MIKATGIAMQAAPIDKTGLRALKASLLAVVASVVLAACGGGAQTTDTPLPNGTGNTNNNLYTGPVARDADVLKFQQQFWSNAKTTDRCGNCHNETAGVLPMFVRNDDVNEAYNAALTKVDIDQPSASVIVSQVGSGHNCWLLPGNDGICASILTTWIEKWVGNAADGGRQIVLTPPDEARSPDQSRNFPDGPNVAGTNGASFASTVYPLLAAPNNYCSGCHSSAEGQNPFFADLDIAAAYEAARPIRGSGQWIYVGTVT